MEEQNPRFTSEITVDLPLFREFLELSIDVYRRNTVILALMVMMLLYCIANMSATPYIGAFIVLGISFPLSYWLKRRKIKDGGVAYRQLLFQHDGKTPHQISYFEENQLVFRNLITGTERKTPYSHYVQLWESKNLLVLILDVNMYQLIDKRSLAGGTSRELIAFLREKCPNLKKKVATGGLCRFVRKLLWFVIALGMVLAVLNFFHIPEKLAGQITNDMSYQEMAAELVEAGIVIDSATLAQLEEYEDTYTDPTAFLYGKHPKVMDLLILEGMGRYDWDTWEWTPSESGVYWFDLEVMNLESIYSDFLRGVAAMDENLTFSGITEDYSGADAEAGTGKIVLSFGYLGQQHTLEAQYNYDWFDTDMLYALGRILAADDVPEDLWMAPDGGQGLLLYYGTQAEVRALSTKTGLTFFDCITMRMGH